MDYLKHYELEREPFQNSSNPDFYFQSSHHKSARLRLVRGLEQRRGLCVVIGGAGCGKTTLATHLAASLPPQRFTAYMRIIPHAACARGWVLPQIARALGAGDAAASPTQTLEHIHHALLASRASGVHTVLLLDEAQLLATAEVMQELRGLLNLSAQGQPLVSIVLLGLEELAGVLRLDHALAQRVEIRVELAPMASDEVREYVVHRLRRAGATGAIFADDAIEALAALSRGVPRLLNTLADSALFEGYLARSRPVRAESVIAAADQLGLSAVDPATASAAGPHAGGVAAHLDPVADAPRAAPGATAPEAAARAAHAVSPSPEARPPASRSPAAASPGSPSPEARPPTSPSLASVSDASPSHASAPPSDVWELDKAAEDALPAPRAAPGATPPARPEGAQSHAGAHALDDDVLVEDGAVLDDEDDIEDELVMTEADDLVLDAAYTFDAGADDAALTLEATVAEDVADASLVLEEDDVLIDAHASDEAPASRGSEDLVLHTADDDDLFVQLTEDDGEPEVHAARASTAQAAGDLEMSDDDLIDASFVKNLKDDGDEDAGGVVAIVADIAPRPAPPPAAAARPAGEADVDDLFAQLQLES
jgi:type II secretory pathway predicted ATPase ExeA